MSGCNYFPAILRLWRHTLLLRLSSPEFPVKDSFSPSPGSACSPKEEFITLVISLRLLFSREPLLQSLSHTFCESVVFLSASTRAYFVISQASRQTLCASLLNLDLEILVHAHAVEWTRFRSLVRLTDTFYTCFFS
jgi:hypothetical protein